MSLVNHLTTLETSGLLRRAQTEPELEYLFRHALVQDAAYESLLKSDRRHLHRTVAATLARLYPDQLDELAATLGFHCEEAGDDEQALQHFLHASEVASQQYANAEAAQHYARAITIARRQARDLTTLSALYFARGQALQLSSQHAAALANYAELEDLARAHTDASAELSALIARLTLHSTPTPVFDPARSQTLAEQGLALARRLPDPAAEGRILWTMMLLNYFTGAMTDSVAYGEQALAMARHFNLREQLAFTLNDLGRSYTGVGQMEQALAVFAEALTLWQALGNDPMRADNLASTAETFYFMGRYAEAYAASSAAYQLSASIHNQWNMGYSQWLNGLTLFDWGDFAQAQIAFADGLTYGVAAGFIAAEIGVRSDLAWLAAWLGDLEQAHAMSQSALALSLKFQIRWTMAWVCATAARIALRQQRVAEAQHFIHDARTDFFPNNFNAAIPQMLALAESELALAEGRPADVITLVDDVLNRMRAASVRSWLCDLWHVQALALRALHRPAEALAVLELARHEAETHHLRRMLGPILTLMIDIHTDQNQTALAEALRPQAQAVYQQLMEACPVEQRAMFLRVNREQ